jgi:hypothetical protein
MFYDKAFGGGLFETGENCRWNQQKLWWFSGGRETVRTIYKLMEEKLMKRKLVLSFLAVMFVAAAATAGHAGTLKSMYHKYVMRGQILDVTGKSVYMCIGSSEGAKVGQKLAVVKFVRVPSASSSQSPVPTFKREEIGVVKITAIVDKHMARATIVSGTAEVNDMVELK